MVAIILKELIYVKHLAQGLSRWILNDTSFLLLFLALDSAQIRIWISFLCLSSYMTLVQPFRLSKPCLLVIF